MQIKIFFKSFFFLFAPFAPVLFEIVAFWTTSFFKKRNIYKTHTLRHTHAADTHAGQEKRESALEEGLRKENSMLGFKIAGRNEELGPEMVERKGKSGRTFRTKAKAKHLFWPGLSHLMKLRRALGWS